MRFILSLLILALAPALSAQIAAPDLQCTRSESGAVILNWENAIVNCGAYEATEIFSATAPEGPYTLVGEVTNPGATTFSDPNPAGELRYYFLRYRYDCPGQTAMPSDTLDSVIPRSPALRFVSVEDDEILIDWQASSSPEVIGYIILEVTPTAFIPLDTVFGVTEYRFSFAAGDPPTETRSFRLVAIDACGNDSPQGTVFSPVGLTGTGGDGCDNAITLNPEAEDLRLFQPLSALELFVSFNGGAFASQGTASPTTASASFLNVFGSGNLCFYYEAVLADGSGRARTTVFCTSVITSTPAQPFPLYGVEVNDAGDLLFQFGANPNQPLLLEAEYLFSAPGGLLTREPSLPEDLRGLSSVTLTGPLAEPLQAGETVAFRITDSCRREVTTNAVEPVYLAVSEFFPGQNQLNWSPLVNGLPGATTYEVLRDDGGPALVPLAAGVTERTFLDDDPPPGGGEVCYVVRASFRPEGGGAGDVFAFSSNRACVLPVPGVYIPTAFSPNDDGTNDVFLPLFSSPVRPEGFLLRIWDRWGSLTHETTNPEEGWDGTDELQPVPPGVYVYVLSYTVGDGERRQRSGTVNMLR